MWTTQHSKRKNPPSPQKATAMRAPKRRNASPEILSMSLVRDGLLRGGQALVSMTDGKMYSVILTHH